MKTSCSWDRAIILSAPSPALARPVLFPTVSGINEVFYFQASHTYTLHCWFTIRQLRGVSYSVTTNSPSCMNWSGCFREPNYALTDRDVNDMADSFTVHEGLNYKETSGTEI